MGQFIIDGMRKKCRKNQEKINFRKIWIFGALEMISLVAMHNTEFIAINLIGEKNTQHFLTLIFFVCDQTHYPLCYNSAWVNTFDASELEILSRMTDFERPVLRAAEELEFRVTFFEKL